METVTRPPTPGYPPDVKPRPRMGRPRVHKDLLTVTVTLPAADWKYCKAQPGGGAYFLRQQIERHRAGE